MAGITRVGQIDQFGYDPGSAEDNSVLYWNFAARKFSYWNLLESAEQSITFDANTRKYHLVNDELSPKDKFYGTAPDGTRGWLSLITYTRLISQQSELLTADLNDTDDLLVLQNGTTVSYGKVALSSLKSYLSTGVVRYDIDQTADITDPEKAVARANIGATNLTLGTTSTTAYYGDKGATAYSHATLTDGSNPHKTIAANISITKFAGTNIDNVQLALDALYNRKDKYLSGVAFDTNGNLVFTITNGNNLQINSFFSKHTLGSHSDVTLSTTPANAALLQYDAVNQIWIDGNLDPYQSTVQGWFNTWFPLNITNPSVNQQLQFDGTNWVNFTYTTPTLHQVLSSGNQSNLSIMLKGTGQYQVADASGAISGYMAWTMGGISYYAGGANYFDMANGYNYSYKPLLIDSGQSIIFRNPNSTNDDGLFAFDAAATATSPTHLRLQVSNVYGGNIILDPKTNVQITTVPNDDTLTDVLVVDASGNVKYRNMSTLAGAESDPIYMADKPNIAFTNANNNFYSGGSYPIKISGTATGISNTAYIPFYESNGATRQAYIGLGSGGTDIFYIDNDITNTQIRLGSNLTFYSGSIDNTIWHAGNSNLSTVDWTVKNLVSDKGIKYSNYYLSTGSDIGTIYNQMSISDASFKVFQVAANTLNRPSGSGASFAHMYATAYNVGTTGSQYAFIYHDELNGLWIGRKSEANRSTPTGTAPTWVKIWTEASDGSGSGLDADLLDGIDSSQIPYALNSGSGAGILGTTNTFITEGGIGANNITRSMFFRDNNNQFGAMGIHVSHSGNSNYAMQLATTSYIATGSLQYRILNNGTWTSPATIWDDSNDGSGSGLDADLLDAQHGTYYDHRRYTDDTNYLGGYYISGGSEKPNDAIFGKGKLKIAMLAGANLGVPSTWNDVLWISTYTGSDVKGSSALSFAKYGPEMYLHFQAYDSATWGTPNRIWHSGNSNVSTLDWTTKGLNVYGNTVLNGSVTSLAYFQNGSNPIGNIIQPGGATYSVTGTQTGAIKITLPNSWTNTMMSMWVDIFDYNGDTNGESISIHLGGYNYSATPSWYHTFAHVVSGRTDKFFNVRFGHDGTNNAIYIGETTSTWDYLKVSVRDVQIGHNAILTDWQNGWSIGTTTTLGTITKTSVGSLVASDSLKFNGLSDSQFLRSDVAVLYNGGTFDLQAINSSSDLWMHFKNAAGVTKWGFSPDWSAGSFVLYDYTKAAYTLKFAENGSMYINTNVTTYGGLSVNSDIVSTNGALVSPSTGSDNTMGLSLYSNGATAHTYGIQFMQTATSGYGTHGSVTSDWAMYFNMSNTATRGWIFRADGGSNVASISTVGIMTLNSYVTATNYKLSSDILKKNVEEHLEKANLNWVDKVDWFSFRWKDRNLGTELRYGVSAQQLQTLNPNLVGKRGDGSLDVAYIDLLIATVARQKQRLDAQDEEIRKLKKQIGLL